MKRSVFLLVLITLTLCLALLPSLLLHPGNFLPDQNDSLQITYNLNQIQDNLLHRQPLFYGLFFSPFKNTLTYNDSQLISATLTLPLRLLPHLSPLIIYNSILILLGFVATALTTFILINHLTQERFLAFLGALLFTFSGYHLKFLPHLNVFNLIFLPLSLFYFHQFTQKPKPKTFFLFCLCLAAQFIDSFFSAYLIVFATIPIFIATSFRENLTHLKQNLLHYLIIILPLIILLATFSYPYLSLHFVFPEASRSIRDSAHFANSLDGLITEYQSLTLLLLLILSIFISRLSKIPNNFKSLTQTYSIIGIFGLIMSLGPVLKISGQTVKLLGYPIPLPYAFFYYLFPGFTGFRTPSRWILLFSLAATILICLNLKGFFSKLSPKNKILSIILVSLLLLLEAQGRHPTFPVNLQIPSVYQEVHSLPADAAILELPIKLWNMPEAEIESLRSLYSLRHGHRRLNGYAGFAPASWIDLVNQINGSGLTPTNISTLRTFGITHVVENNALRPL